MPVGKTYVKVASQTLSASVSSVTFSNIPQNYTDLILMITRKTNSSVYEDMKMQINADTGNSYSTTTVGGWSTSSYESLRYSNYSSSIFVDADAGSSKTANYYNPVIIQLMNYSNSSTYKTWLVRGGNTEQGVEAMVGLWRSKSAINSFTFSLTASTFSSGSTFSIYGIEAAKSPKADGGDSITTDGVYWYHAFKSSAVFSTKQSLTCDYLVVAGGGCGGGAGFSSWGYGGGGGAGGLVYASSQSLSGSYAVTVGGGGIFASGSNSSISSSTATGGGRGGYYTGSAYTNGSSGGSGGGGGTSNASTGGTASPSGQGNAGGAGDGTNNNGGGGGGASAAGNAGSANGNGGAGSSTYSSWGAATGTGQNVSSTYYYAGGGGGMKGNFGTGAGGNGGGGQGSQSSGSIGTSGTANTGGGGGGAFAGNGQTPGLGGSGIVIVRYPV